LKRVYFFLHQQGCNRVTKCFITCKLHGMETQAGPAAIMLNRQKHKLLPNAGGGCVGLGYNQLSMKRGENRTLKTKKFWNCFRGATNGDTR